MPDPIVKQPTKRYFLMLMLEKFDDGKLSADFREVTVKTSQMPAGDLTYFNRLGPSVWAGAVPAAVRPFIDAKIKNLKG